MRARSIATALAALLLLGLGAGCSDADDGEATPASPVDTATATIPPETPTPGITPPAAADPVLPSGAEFVTEGMEETTLVAGASLDLDPVHLAVRDVGAAPPCAGLVGQWAWAATSAGAGGDPSALRVVANRQGGEWELGAGAAGTSEGGCFLAQFRNESSGPIQLQVRYIIGSIE